MMKVVGRAALSKGGKAINLHLFGDDENMERYVSIPKNQLEEVLAGSGASSLTAEVREYSLDPKE
jgi:hypothetical protein